MCTGSFIATFVQGFLTIRYCVGYYFIGFTVEVIQIMYIKFVPSALSGAAHLCHEWLFHPDAFTADTKIRLTCLIIPQSSVYISCE